MRVNPVFENDDGVLTHVSSILCPMSSDSASLQQSGQGTFRSIESLQLSIEVKCTVKVVFLRVHYVMFGHLALINKTACLLYLF